MGRRLAALSVLAALFLSARPASAARTREQVELLRRDVTDLQARVVELQQAQEEVLRQLVDLRLAVGLDDPGRATPADLAARMGSIEGDLRVLFEQQGETSSRLSVVSDRLDALYRHRERWARTATLRATEGEQVASDAAADPFAERLEGEAEGPAAGAPDAEGTVGIPEPPPLVDPQELYQAARADYARGAHALAVAGFEEFLQFFPDSDLADNARYWIGEARYAEGRHADALAAFTDLVRLHPDSDKVPDAEYKRALCQLQLNEIADGILQLQRVRDVYPDTAAARLARQKLESLGLM